MFFTYQNRSPLNILFLHVPNGSRVSQQLTRALEVNILIPSLLCGRYSNCSIELQILSKSCHANGTIAQMIQRNSIAQKSLKGNHLPNVLLIPLITIKYQTRSSLREQEFALRVGAISLWWRWPGGRRGRSSSSGRRQLVTPRK